MTSLRDLDMVKMSQIKNSLVNQDYMAIAVLIGPKYVIEDANDLVCQIWGRTNKEVLNRPLFTALPEMQGQGVDKLLENVLTTGKQYIGKDLPVKIHRNNRLDTVYFDFIYSPMRDESTNEITGITVIATEVTTQVNATHELETSEKRYRTLVEQSPLSMQILSPEGMTLHVNKAWETLWGAHLEQLVDYNMLEDKQLTKLGIMPFIKAGFAGTPTFIPAAKYQPQKTVKSMTEVPYRWVQAFIYPIKDEENNIQEVVLIHQDITDLKKSEAKSAKLAAERSELITLNRAKDDFIALASHQLRTPATAVKQFIGIALDGHTGELNSEQTEVLTKANICNERQLTIVDDLLRVAQIDSGILRLNKSRQDVVSLVKDILNDHKAVFEKRKQGVTFNTDNPSIETEVDIERIRMVLENIIDNASKYSPSEKQIRVKVSTTKHHVQISVIDEGVGIKKDHIDKLFQKFSRIDNPLSVTVGGTGLGLYWAKKIVELHGGDIEAKPNFGTGTTFTVCIPLT